MHPALRKLARRMSKGPNHHPPTATVDPGSPGILRLRGRWTLRFASELGDALRATPEGVTQVDAGGCERLDTLGVLQLLRFAERKVQG